MGRRIVEIEPTLLLGQMEEGWVIGEERTVRVTNGVPKGTKIVRCWVRQEFDPNGKILMLLEHPAWSETVEGGEYEHFTPTYQTRLRPPQIDQGGEHGVGQELDLKDNPVVGKRGDEG